LAKAGVALAGVTAAMVGLGMFMTSGIGAVAIAAGAAAVVLMSGALFIFGKSVQSIASAGTGLSVVSSTLEVLGGIKDTFKFKKLADDLKTLVEPLREIAEEAREARQELFAMSKINLLAGISNAIVGALTPTKQVAVAQANGEVRILDASVYLDKKKVGKVIYSYMQGE